jgi:hypothetical protein
VALVGIVQDHARPLGEGAGEGQAGRDDD